MLVDIVKTRLGHDPEIVLPPVPSHELAGTIEAVENWYYNDNIENCIYYKLIYFTLKYNFLLRKYGLRNKLTE